MSVMGSLLHRDGAQKVEIGERKAISRTKVRRVVSIFEDG